MLSPAAAEAEIPSLKPGKGDISYCMV